MNAEILIVGDEILNGSTLDTNSQFISQQLEAINVKIVGRNTVSDESAAIEEGIERAMGRADLLIMTGGLGPTKDDITKKTIARYFNQELVENSEVLEHVRNFFERRGRTMLEVNKHQALVPASAKVLFNHLGTAPGMWLESDGKILVSMPGVPYEMRHIVETSLVPMLSDLGKSTVLHKRTIHTVGIGESALAKKIAAVEDALPSHIKLAYLPSTGAVKLRLMSEGDSLDQLKKEVGRFEAEIASIAGEYIFGYDDSTLSSAIGEMLKAQGKTLGTAESCTAGFLAHEITLTPGSSAYYSGSILSYSNELKQKLLQVPGDLFEKHGAVSKEVAEAMVAGALGKLGTDYALATTGIAGPDGGSEEKPVGTVWIAVGDRHRIVSKKFVFTKNRAVNIQLSATMALDLLRRFISAIEI